MRILLVEDSDVERALLKSLLSREGFDIVGEAASGVLAVEQFRRLKPDVALVDLLLPQMSGIEVARAILTLHPDAKLIAISGLCQPSVMAEVEAVGMCGFVPKPIDREELLSEIQVVTESGDSPW